MKNKNVNLDGSLENLLESHLINTSDNSLTTELVKNADNKNLTEQSIDYSSLDPFNADNI